MPLDKANLIIATIVFNSPISKTAALEST